VIVPMKNVTIATPSNAQAATLADLQDLGVVHLAAAPRSTGETATELRERLSAVRQVSDVLVRAARDADDAAESGQAAAAGRHNPPPPDASETDPTVEEVVLQVERLSDEIEALREQRDELLALQARLAPFGAFDPVAVRRLAAHGVALRLARPALREALPEVEGAAWVELPGRGRERAAVLVGPVEVVADAPVPNEVAVPEDAPDRLATAIEDVERSLEQTRERLATLAKSRERVEGWLRRTEEALAFEEARSRLETIGAVAFLRGFVPEEQVPRLRTLAERRGWGLWVSDVTDPDEAPTLIRMPRWVRPIEPLFSFLGVIPGYGQVDVSIPFLVFFSLFFAMIVGDAGYGFVFLALTEIGARRFPSAPRTVISLMRLLSAATIVWGVATGNYFGIEALPPVLAALQLDWLTEESNLIGLVFLIGAVHLTLAHGWNVVRFINSRRALAELGWIGTTWTMYFLARQLVLNEPFPSLAWGTFIGGVTLIVLFTTPWRLLRRSWFKHAMLPLNLVSNFVDVVSYVRLYAVGAATFAVAVSFNELAAGIGIEGPIGALVSALVLFFGHTLNVLLAAMGVLVHGVRLNTLEFAGHLGLSWTGQPYRPFARAAGGAMEGDTA